MHWSWIARAAVVASAVACSSSGVGHGTSISPPAATASPSPTGVSPTPTGSPGPASRLTVGTASVALTGDLTLTATFAPLDDPAVWAPPPAPMDLTWSGPGPTRLNLAGTSFLSRADTSPERTLSFTVRGPGGPVAFVSAAGECSVTITPALPENMGGVFTCTALTDADGTMTVDARGSFTATG